MYKYKDNFGKDCFVYSWTLTKSDRVPKGHECTKCLREMEVEITRASVENVSYKTLSKSTLNDLWDTFIQQKIGWEDSTRYSHVVTYDKHIRNTLGKMKVSEIKYSKVKQFYLDKLSNNELTLGSLTIISNMLNPVFEMAIRDEYIRTNPVKGVINEIKKEVSYQQPKRHALTKEEQSIFVQCVKNNSKHRDIFPLVIFLLGTGCRIGEAIGLRWEDCDFKNGIISIRRSMSYTPGRNDKTPKEPKTKAGIRDIPMLASVKSVLLELKNGGKAYGHHEFDDYVFRSKNGNLLCASTVQVTIKNIVKSYNDTEIKNAKLEKREPKLLPHITPHILRHTFCSRFCENETNLKVIQEIMGHANISITMDVYNEATMDVKKKSFDNLNDKLFVY